MRVFLILFAVVAMGVVNFASSPLFSFAAKNPLYEGDFGLKNSFVAGKITPPTLEGSYPARIVGSLLNVFLGLLAFGSLIAVIAGGVIWMGARGNEEEVSKGRNIIKYAVIGIVVAFSGYVVLSFVEREIRTRVKNPSSSSGAVTGACVCGTLCYGNKTSEECTNIGTSCTWFFEKACSDFGLISR